MAKLITLRYAAKCRVCGKEIPSGTRAMYGGSKAISHVECEKPKASSSTNQPEQTVFNYDELRRDYIGTVAGNHTADVLKLSGNQRKWDSLKSDRQDEGNWTGCTNVQMLDWLNSGYRVPGLEGVDSTLIPAAPKRKLRFAEEGDEMLIDLAWSGVDEHFITWDRRDTKPSLKVKISVSFSAIIPSAIVNSYQSWVARMLQTIDLFGLDMQVDLISPGRGQFGNPNAVHAPVIRVKQSGTASDFSNWSPMFSPGGFRHLTFLAIIESADRAGHIVSSGLGRPVQCDTWKVTYDKETNELFVMNNNDRSEFPEFLMTQQLIAILTGIGK